MAMVLVGETVLRWVAEQQFSLSLVSHRLPFWFLVFALFLPRVALVVAWVQGVLIPFHLQGIVPLLCAIILPRVLVLFLIYVDQGLSLWFVIHLVVALLVWGGGGHQMSQRRRNDY
ncbi:MAG TPA: hypothetical protein VK627_06535 [Edaphobacter sp.]|nr:hypothetical protein [Edaphobacter sp.]